MKTVWKIFLVLFICFSIIGLIVWFLKFRQATKAGDRGPTGKTPEEITKENQAAYRYSLGL